jgi:hypothetical protein
MPRRGIGQLSWVDGALARRRGRRRDGLAEIERLVDWAPFARLLAPIHCAVKGEAAYPPLMMFKVVLLQRWYGLSDPQMEEALFDRMSFLSFVGLSAEDETPDHTTIWRFRQKLAEGGLIEALVPVPPHAVFQCRPQRRRLRAGLHRVQPEAMARPRYAMRRPATRQNPAVCRQNPAATPQHLAPH